MQVYEGGGTRTHDLGIKRFAPSTVTECQPLPSRAIGFAPSDRRSHGVTREKHQCSSYRINR